MNQSSRWIGLVVAALAVQMSGRILTPNGDGINDTVAFTLADPAAFQSHAQVYDTRGRRVAVLSPVSSTQMRWDGRDQAGSVVGSGMYLVQINEGSQLWSGVVAVAR